MPRPPGMADKTPRLSRISEELAAAYREAKQLAVSYGHNTPRGARHLKRVLDVLQDVRWWNQQRLECIYVLDQETPEPPSPWHARQRRELAQLDESERAELIRLIARKVT
jgi:hypothetical protein